MPPPGLALLALLATSFAAVAAAPATWTDFNQNGRKDVYEDAAQPIERRIEDLLAQMNVAEKTCQLATLYGYGRVLKDPLPTPEWKTAIWKDDSLSRAASFKWATRSPWAFFTFPSIPEIAPLMSISLASSSRSVSSASLIS